MGMLGFFKKKEVPKPVLQQPSEELADPEFPQSTFTTPAQPPGKVLPDTNPILGEPGHNFDHRDDLGHVPDFSDEDIAAAAKHDMGPSGQNAAPEPLPDPKLFDKTPQEDPFGPDSEPPTAVQPPLGDTESPEVKNSTPPPLEDANPFDTPSDFAEQSAPPSPPPPSTTTSPVTSPVPASPSSSLVPDSVPPSPTPDWAADPEPSATVEPSSAPEAPPSEEFEDLPPLPSEPAIDRHYIPLLEYKTAFDGLGDLRKTVTRSQASIKKITQDITAQKESYERFAEAINTLQQQLIQMDDVLLNKR